MKNIEIILLAAGASSRMRGDDKLTKEINGEALIRRSAKTALASRAQTVHVVLQPDNHSRSQCLVGLPAHQVINENWHLGLGASIVAGVAAVSENCDAVIIALADMPEITAAHFDTLIDTFDPINNTEICRNCAFDGQAGLPVLFGARFFPELRALTGDQGAKTVIKANTAYLKDIKSDDNAAVVDLDTPEDWQKWQANPLK